MKILSWNVNGIRSVMCRGFLNFLEEYSPDILCLQEIKAGKELLPIIKDYHAFWFPAKKLGYAGVGVLTKK